MSKELDHVSTRMLTGLVQSIINNHAGQYNPDFIDLEVDRAEAIENIIIVQLNSRATSNPIGTFKVTVEKWPG
jgi:hypothetical protein